MSRSCRLFNIRAAFLCGFALAIHVSFLCSEALADPQVLKGVENGGEAVTPRAVNTLVPVTSPGPNPTGTVTTDFKFHPEQNVGPDTFVKSRSPGGNLLINHQVPPPAGSPPGTQPTLEAPTVTHTYPGTELHNTTGSVTYTAAVQAAPTPPGGFRTSFSAAPTITPGNNNQTVVSITAKYTDPFTFSDTSPSALFKAVPSGLNVTPLLLAGTAFPSVLAPDLQSVGALPVGTSMVFNARVAPGVITSGSALFGPNVPGAIDLYTLTLTTDITHTVHAALTFGASNSGFALDFLNNNGQVFDPTNPASVAALQTFISNSFSNGVLNADLNNAFTVGFVPTNGTSEFSLGYQQIYNLAGVETQLPEPSSWLLVASGLGGLALGRARRKRGAPVTAIS